MMASDLFLCGESCMMGTSLHLINSCSEEILGEEEGHLEKLGGGKKLNTFSKRYWHWRSGLALFILSGERDISLLHPLQPCRAGVEMLEWTESRA